jgi:Flp pilus assembly protein TadB
MTQKLLSKFLLYLSMVVLLLAITSCVGSKSSKAIKVQQKREATAKKAAEKEYKAMVKSHHKRQSDATQTMMKKTKKQNKKLIKPFKKKRF